MNREIRMALAWAGFILAFALAATTARRWGYVDRDTVMRMVMGLNGVWIVWYGNRIPKTFAPGAGARRVKRVSGWSMVLSGLAYAGLFAFAPLPVAFVAGSGAVVAGVAVTFGYCLSLRARARAA
ncbi:MAG TPA: ammonium transporter [Allosphingosinicella sp.]|nr:ammonium transporter [Allosphingosinicella sp.]